jgi:hypothetical protein
MKQRQPGPENLIPEILEEQASELYGLGISDPEAIRFVLAQSIVINSLGGWPVLGKRVHLAWEKAGVLYPKA